jgi:hypothetical protein
MVSVHAERDPNLREMPSAVIRVRLRIEYATEDASTIAIAL